MAQAFFVNGGVRRHAAPYQKRGGIGIAFEADYFRNFRLSRIHVLNEITLPRWNHWNE
jgi:hypothetical protein